MFWMLRKRTCIPGMMRKRIDRYIGVRALRLVPERLTGA